MRSARACTDFPHGRLSSLTPPNTHRLRLRSSRSRAGLVPGRGSSLSDGSCSCLSAGLRVSLAARLSPHNQKYPRLEAAGAGLAPARQRTQPQRQRERTVPKAQGTTPCGQAPSPAAPPTDLTPASSCCVSSSKVLPCWAILFCKNKPRYKTE